MSGCLYDYAFLNGYFGNVRLPVTLLHRCTSYKQCIVTQYLLPLNSKGNTEQAGARL